MPDHRFYRGLSDSQALAAMAAHHHEKSTRHISLFESRLLERAAEKLAGLDQIRDGMIRVFGIPDEDSSSPS